MNDLEIPSIPSSSTSASTSSSTSASSSSIFSDRSDTNDRMTSKKKTSTTMTTSRRRTRRRRGRPTTTTTELQTNHFDSDSNSDSDYAVSKSRTGWSEKVQEDDDDDEEGEGEREEGMTTFPPISPSRTLTSTVQDPSMEGVPSLQPSVGVDVGIAYPRSRPRSSPFSSPRKNNNDNNNNKIRNPHPSKQRESQSFPTPSTCPDDCRCSDREIQMGRCACALGGSAAESGSETSTSGISTTGGEEKRMRDMQVKMNWSRGQRLNGLHQRDKEGEGSSWRPADQREPSLSTPSSLRSGFLNRGLPNLKGLPGSTSEDDDGPSGKGRSDSSSKLPFTSRSTLKSLVTKPIRRELPLLRSSASLSIRGADEDDEPEARRKRRREERDRLIRQRIEEKRKSREDGDPSPSRPSEQSLTPSTTMTPGVSRRERSFEEEERRLRRLSKPPSATSVAAFAAQVSPSKSGTRRSVPREAAEAADGVESSALQHSIDLSMKRTLKQVLYQETAARGVSSPVTGQAAQGGFSFSPQRMSADVPAPSSPLSSPATSPRRAAHRRTGGGEGEVVSVATNLPAHGSFEARQRLPGALRSPDEIGPSLTLTPRFSSTRRGTMSLEVDNSNATASRKSVRFSPEAEFLPARLADGSTSSSDRQEHIPHGTDMRSGTSSDSPEMDEEESTDEGSDGQGEVGGEQGSAVQTLDNEPATTPATPLPGTPVKLPPGAFGSPFGLGRLPKDAAEDSPSFSIYTLRPRVRQSVLSTQGQGQTPPKSSGSPKLPAPAETPMPPGGMRILKGNRFLPAFSPSASLLESSKQSRRATQASFHGQGANLAQQGERGLPPSYSAVTASSPSTSFSMTRSDSVESASTLAQATTTMGRSSLVALDDDDDDDAARGVEETGNDLDSGVSASHDPPPRQSTPPPPPPLPTPTPTMKVRPPKRLSLAEAVPWTHLEDLRGIDSPPESRSSTPNDVVNVQEEGEEEREDHPDLEEATAAADDSIRATLARFTSTLSASKPSFLLPTSFDLITEKDQQGKFKEEKKETMLQSTTLHARQLLLQVKGDEDRAKDTRAKRERVDSEQMNRIRASHANLFSNFADLRVRPGTGWYPFQGEVGSGSDERSIITTNSGSRIKNRWKTPLFWLLIQLSILWLALLVMRQGAYHLHRTVYYDPFYPHLYDYDYDYQYQYQYQYHYENTLRTHTHTHGKGKIWLFHPLKTWTSHLNLRTSWTRWMISSSPPFLPYPPPTPPLPAPPLETLSEEPRITLALARVIQNVSQWLALVVLRRDDSSLAASSASSSSSSSSSSVSYFVPV